MRRALLLSSLVLVMSCGAPTGDLQWGSELEEYFGAFASAASNGDLDQTMAFFNEDSRFVDSSGVSAIGLRRIDTSMRSVMWDDLEVTPVTVLAALDQRDDRRRHERATFGLVPGDVLAISEVRFGQSQGCPADRVPCTLREMAVVTLDDSFIGGYTILGLAGDVAGLAPDDPEILDAFAALERFHRDYAEAWSSAAPTEVAGMYDRHATLDHGAWGISARGSEAIASSVARLRSEVGTTRWEPATLADLGLSSDEPAVFVAGSPLEPHLMAGLYRMTEPDLESAIVGVVWRRAPNGIAHEWSAWQVGSPAVADLVSSTRPWWSDLEIPWVEAPECEAIEGPSGDSVEVCNGTPELVAEVRWALSRFGLAGLDQPVPSRISFPPSTRCRQVPGEGWAVDTGEGLDLLMCRVDDLERLRFVMLHELGHVWSNQHLDEARRDAFADSRGLDGWRDPDGEWRDQGSEHAAEIIAWGLMDRPVPMTRLPDASCARLAAGFRMLTGRDPLVTQEECETG